MPYFLQPVYNLNRIFMKTLINRMASNTPKWFQVIRNIGLILTAVGTTIVSIPIALPAIIVTVGGYLIVGGAVAAAVSQSATVAGSE